MVRNRRKASVHLFARMICVEILQDLKCIDRHLYPCRNFQQDGKKCEYFHGDSEERIETIEDGHPEIGKVEFGSKILELVGAATKIPMELQIMLKSRIMSKNLV